MGIFSDRNPGKIGLYSMPKACCPAQRRLGNL
jgi:hypothetical protein